jgi:hypothetical protein
MDTSIANFSINFTKTDDFDYHVEALLADVHQEDQSLVRNVISLLATIRPYKFVHNYKLKVTKKGYDLIAILKSTHKDEAAQDVIVTGQDFDLVMNLNPARIATVLIQIGADTPPQMIVRLLRTDQAIVYNDVQVSHVRKKARWWG